MVENITWNWEQTVYEDLSNTMGDNANQDLKELNSKVNKLRIKNRTFSLVIVALGMQVVITGFVLYFLVPNILKNEWWVWPIIGYFVLVTVPFIYLIVQNFIINKQIRKLDFILGPAMKQTKEIDYEKLYRKALEEMTNNKYHLIGLSQKFHIQSTIDLPKNSYASNHNVLNIYEKDTDFIYSLGTISLGQTVKNIVEYSPVTYFNVKVKKSYDYYGSIILKNTEYKNLINDNTVLESNKFEELFIVNSSNQIGVRKLLTPKVISNLVKQINRKNLPVIGVKDDVITFAFDQKDSEYNQNKILDDSEIEKDNFYKSLCQKITKDINSFLEALYWVDVLGLK